MSAQGRDNRDLIGGVILIGVGLFAALYAGSAYSLGTVRQMGPGMVPTILGCVLAGLGLLIAVPAMFREAALSPPVEWRPLIMVALSVAAFALTIERLGLLPAVIIMTVLAAMADRKLGLVAAVLLGAALAALAVAIFIFGLSVPIRILRWSW